MMSFLLIAIVTTMQSSAEWDYSKGLPSAKVTIQVQDDQHKVITGARVVVCFVVSAGPASGSKSIERAGLTDTGGVFTAFGETAEKIFITVEMDSYYSNYTKYRFTNVVANKWQPWNPVVTQVLRRVENPIPMYAKHVEADLPSADQPVGYDLIAGDWITPYGKGTHEDLIFKVTKRRVISFKDFNASLLLDFSNKTDGLRRKEGGSFGDSRFPWSYNAPEEGYDESQQISIGYLPGKGYFETNESATCYFRVRTVTNEQGVIVSSYYGKMPEPIKFDVRDTKTGWIKFTYYINPTPNDRNMEFDPKKNLFKNLKSTEEVTAP